MRSDDDAVRMTSSRAIPCPIGLREPGLDRIGEPTEDREPIRHVEPPRILGRRTGHGRAREVVECLGAVEERAHPVPKLIHGARRYQFVEPRTTHDVWVDRREEIALGCKVTGKSSGPIRRPGAPPAGMDTLARPSAITRTVASRMRARVSSACCARSWLRYARAVLLTIRVIL